MTMFASTKAGKKAANKMMKTHGHTNAGMPPAPGFPGSKTKPSPKRASTGAPTKGDMRPPSSPNPAIKPRPGRPMTSPKPAPTSPQNDPISQSRINRISERAVFPNPAIKPGGSGGRPMTSPKPAPTSVKRPLMNASKALAGLGNKPMQQKTLMKKGGYVKSADGCAKKGRTKGRMS